MASFRKTPVNTRSWLDISHFSPNAILRGVQLTFVGAHRSLQNPALFTSDHYRQAAHALAAGIAIRLLVEIPNICVKVLKWCMAFFYPEDRLSWLGAVSDDVGFIGNHVLQLPLFFMAVMQHLSPTLDELFMQSLKWVDHTNRKKHEHTAHDKFRVDFYQNLKEYPRFSAGYGSPNQSTNTLHRIIFKYCRKGLVSLLVMSLSYLPGIGQLILPALSFYTFKNAVGFTFAGVIFGSSIVLPRRYLIIFLQTYFATRTLTRELLEPYFSRVPFTKRERANWFRSREGVLFGFGLGFYLLTSVPLVGVLIYGIAEGSAAYLISKVTDPLPLPQDIRQYAIRQQTWTNKQFFLNLAFSNID